MDAPGILPAGVPDRLIVRYLKGDAEMVGTLFEPGSEAVNGHGRKTKGAVLRPSSCISRQEGPRRQTAPGDD